MLSAIWSLLGIIGLIVPGVDILVLMLPAMPLYLVTTVIDSTATHGLLWDSAHSPPYLNSVGVAVVYVLPGIVSIALFALSVGRTPTRGSQ
jgi:hypothetical protein